MWEEPCHATVPWDRISVGPEDRGAPTAGFEHALVCRTEDRSWELYVADAIAAGVVFELAKQLGQLGPALLRGPSGAADGESRERLLNLFPFVSDAEVFVGNRYHWVDAEFGSLIGALVSRPRAFALLDAARRAAPDGSALERWLSRRVDRLVDAASVLGGDGEAAGPLSTNEVFGVLRLVLVMGTALNGAVPDEVGELPARAVDFSRSLVSVGGPVPNLYTRNLLYGDAVSLPYRYDLNPDDDDAVAALDPLALRREGLDDGAVVQTRKPNWTIVGADGSPATVANKPAVPRRADRHWSEDFFMIAKTPNVHPSADGTDCLHVSGCHGVGSRAALLALQQPRVLETIESVAKAGYFQALGRVSNPRPNEPLQPGQTTLEPEDVHVLPA